MPNAASRIGPPPVPDRVFFRGVRHPLAPESFLLRRTLRKAYLVGMHRTHRAMAAKILVGLVALQLHGCAPRMVPMVRGMRESWTPVRVALFLPFESRPRDKGGEYLDDAAMVVREAVSKELVRRGCSVAADSAVDMVVRSSVGEHQNLTFGQAAQIAGKVGADIAMIGQLADYRRGSLFGPSSRVALRFDVVAVDGQGLGSVKYEETAAQEDPAVLARDVSIKIADSIDSAWGGCSRAESRLSDHR